MSETLYDAWELPSILGQTCGAKGNFKNCPTESYQHISKFRDQTYKQLKEAVTHNPNRGIWAPACVFHCFFNYGENKDALKY